MGDSENLKRRRGLGMVTPNACTECRKKRAKCDGNQPCGRCASQNTGCIYDIPVRQSKEHMRSEIEHLRAQQHQSERVLAALVSSEKSDQVLELLRNGETLEVVSSGILGKERDMTESSLNPTTYSNLSDRHALGSALQSAKGIASSPRSNLAYRDPYVDSLSQQDPSTWTGWRDEDSGQSYINHEDILRWPPDSPISRHESLPLVEGRHQQSDVDSNPDNVTQPMGEQDRKTILDQRLIKEDSSEHIRIESWTDVTTDSSLVEHLTALYFCWEYPTFASLSKEHFLVDFHMGRQTHCSSLLVNAILAVGCRFSTQAAARTVPSDSNTTGDHFFAEASRLLLLEEDRHILTTVQALGLMSIREASCGRLSDALYYSGQSIRLAIEMGLHLESQSGGGDNPDLEHTVRSATLWGAFALDQCWSLLIGRVPHVSKDIKLVAKPAIVEHIEASPWIPYTDDADGLSGALWQIKLTGRTGTLESDCTQPSNVRSVYWKFCELSEIVHKAQYTFFTPGTQVTSKTLLELYTQYLRWYDATPEALRLGHNFTPCVLFAHMYYHLAILLLFRPFIKLELVGSGVSPRDVCAQAADAIMALVNSYAQFYTLRRTPSFVPFFVLTASITHLVTVGSGSDGPAQLNQGMADLKTMAICHGFSTQARDILRTLAENWQVDVALDQSDGADPEAAFHPQSASLGHFCPNIGMVDISCDLNPFKAKGETPLFLPFPMHGRPLIGIGSDLELAGFRRLV